MSLLPELDKKLITKGWARVDTGQPIKRHYQWYSLCDSKWIQCSKYSPTYVKYESLYRCPTSIISWIKVLGRMLMQTIKTTLSK